MSWWWYAVSLLYPADVTCQREREDRQVDADRQEAGAVVALKCGHDQVGMPQIKCRCLALALCLHEHCRLRIAAV